MCMLKHTSPIFVVAGVEIDWGLVVLSFLLLAYYNIDFVTAAICTVFYGGLWYLSAHIYFQYKASGELDQHFRLFLIQHIISWIAQFIGHGIFEKRNPALVDNLLLTLVAPAFVILEIMFKVGYRKNDQAEIEQRINNKIKEFRANKAKKAEWKGWIEIYYYYILSSYYSIS